MHFHEHGEISLGDLPGGVAPTWSKSVDLQLEAALINSYFVQL
jgi:hypothetical protein